jgi:hypothetical protein
MAEEIPLRPTHCLLCGEPAQFSAWQHKVTKGVGAQSLRRKDLGKPEAWIHTDGNKRDHPAMPADDRSGEDDAERQRRDHESARIGMKRNLSRQFDYLTAEKTVNEIAKQAGLE